MFGTDIDLRYWADGQKKRLPSWSKFYLELGAAIARKGSVQQRLVTALAVPTRSYAAVLAAAGAVITNATTADSQGQASLRAHFEMLNSLPSGTSVILRQGGRAVKGIFVGTRDNKNDGTVRIGIQTQSSKGGALTEWLPLESSLKVQVSSTPWSNLPTDVESARVVNTSSSDFISQVFQGADLWNFVMKSTLDCVILGTASSLEQEATATKLSVGSCGSESSTGTLQDILRIRRLCRSDEAFRSEIFPVNVTDHVKTTVGLEPQFVIFDGPAGFLKWRQNWSSHNWVVILDRTETRFMEAVQVVNEEFLGRIDERKLNLSIPNPQSVELVSFTVAR